MHHKRRGQDFQMSIYTGFLRVLESLFLDQQISNAKVASLIKQMCCVSCDLVNLWEKGSDSISSPEVETCPYLKITMSSWW